MKSISKTKNNFNSERKINNIFEMLESNINISLNTSNDNNYCLNDKPMNIILLNNNMNIIEDMINTNIRKNYNKEDSFDIKNLMKTNTLDKRLFINMNFMKINKDIKRNYQFYINNLNIFKNNSFSIVYNMKKSFKNKTTNNRIISGIFKLEKIKINDIFKNKYLFMKFLKTNKFCRILLKIVKNKIKNYINILKKNIKIKSKSNMKSVKFSFKNINQYNKNINNKINKKSSFNFVVESMINSECNFINPKTINKLQGKEKLKFLIKQLNNNSKDLNCQNDNFGDKNNKCIDLTYDSDEEQKKNIYISSPNNLNNLKNKEQNNVYLRKKFYKKLY